MKSLLIVLLLILPITYADDEYKPYLHEAQVADNPELGLSSKYSTNLFTGGASFQYELELPPGVKNLAPSLAIEYQSHDKSISLLEPGWSVSQDMIVRELRYNSNRSDDTFLLLLQGKSHRINFSQKYYTEIHAYLDIRYENDSWKIRTTDGTLYLFGSDERSKVIRLENETGRWYLSKIIDTHGNTIDYEYLKNPFEGDESALYPSKISYNRERSREIHYSYEKRPNPRKVFVQGLGKRYAKRLSEIKVLVNNEIVWKYQLSYSALNVEKTKHSLTSLNKGASQNVLYTLAFDYYSDKPGFVSSATHLSPLFFNNDTTSDYGVRFADINGDGFIDLLKGIKGENRVYLNSQKGEWNISSEVFPQSFINNLSRDDGLRFLHANNDGAIDFVYASADYAKKSVYLWNTGNWVENNSWTIPDYIQGNNIDFGMRIIDLNGDGLSDLVQKNGTKNFSWINTGSNWIKTHSWILPVSFVLNNKDSGLRVVDLNGDGFSDLIRGDPFSKGVWLNTGTNWTVSKEFIPPLNFTNPSQEDQGVRFFDINGDELVDMVQDYSKENNESSKVWLNNGSGWVESSRYVLNVSFVKNGKNKGRRLADVNGDGYTDIVIAYEELPNQIIKTYLRNQTNAFLLKSVTNELGGVESIEYSSSTRFDKVNLSSVFWLVQNITKDTGLAVFNTSYSYEDGKYDSSRREFMGFSTVTEAMPDNSFSKYEFYQGWARKGELRRLLEYSKKGELVREQQRTVSTEGNNSRKVLLDEESEIIYNNAMQKKVVNKSYEYDDFGNILCIHYKGDVEVLGDEKHDCQEYATNEENYIVNRPIHQYMYASDNKSLIKSTRYWYDGLSFDDVGSQGNPTQVRKWNSHGKDSIYFFSYDRFGNIIRRDNKKGQITKYRYGLRDPSFTYLDKVTNALGHYVDYAYDSQTGNLKWVEKEGIRTSYVYDEFGRVVKEILPYDTYQLPSKEYWYDFNGLVPQRIRIAQRESASNYTQIDYYYDGYAQLVQVQQIIENNQVIIKNYEYDEKGRVISEQNPYFDSYTGNYIEPNSSVGQTTYEYDVMNRIIRIVNPDETQKRTIFNLWTVSEYDEINNRKDYLLDPFGNVVNVLEYNSKGLVKNQSEVYNTSYTYDHLGKILEIKDDKENKFAFEYDSLGRKVAMTDPTLGIWKYKYDENGNLIAQQDSRGIAIEFSYDYLNRVLTKNSTDANISFEYDKEYWGTLSKVTKQNKNYAVPIIFSFTYDERLRVKNTSLSIKDRKTQKVHYDSMNRVIQKNFPLHNIGYFYNKQGKVSKIDNLLPKIEYNSFGVTIRRDYQNGLSSLRNYSFLRNRLDYINTPNYQEISYDYDDVGNVESIKDSIREENYSIKYDSLNRLVRSASNSEFYQYEYDSIGNIRKIVRNNETKRLIYLAKIPHMPSEIITSTPGLGIYYLEEIKPSISKTYQFYLIKERVSVSPSNVSAKFESNKSNLLNLPFTSSPTLVILQHNYSKTGSQLLNITTNRDQRLEINEVGVKIIDLAFLAQNKSTGYHEIMVSSNAKGTEEIQWNCQNISSEIINMTKPRLIVFIEQKFESSGEKVMNCKIHSENSIGNSSLDYKMKGLEILDYSSKSVNSGMQQIKFKVRNHWGSLSSLMHIKTENFSDSEIITLESGKEQHVEKNITFETDKKKIILINISSNDSSAQYIDEIYLQALLIESYHQHLRNNSAIATLEVANKWNAPQRVSWTMGNFSSKSSSNLQKNQTIFLLISQNITSQLKQDLQTNLQSENFTTKVVDRVKSTPILFGQQVLSQTMPSTIVELTIDSAQKNQSIDWELDSVSGLIVNKLPTRFKESVIVLIEANHSSSKIHTIQSIVNSSKGFNQTKEMVLQVK